MQNKSSNLCPLCRNKGVVFHETKRRQYFKCNNCFGIFIDKEQMPGRVEEKLRYEEHNNDVDDKKYQSFVSPITSAILKDFNISNEGLDFGAGTGPVISKILKDNKYQIKLYDPFFHNFPELLNIKYDYIACCEVIEHFHEPRKEFVLLKSLLKQTGKLYCMTDVYNENTKFKNWYYLNDLSHVFIYHKQTINWIKEEFGFSSVSINGRLIVFSN